MTTPILYEYHYKLLNELNIRIETRDADIPLEWFHLIRGDDFCNLKWHTHPSVEMHCILHGSDEFAFENEVIQIHENQCLLIPPKVMHHRTHLQDESLLKYTLNFSIGLKNPTPEMTFLTNAFHADKHQVFTFPDSARDAFSVCLREATERNAGFMTVIQAELLSALFSLARELANYPKADYQINTRRIVNDERYQMIEQYALAHLNADISVEAIAAYLNLSTKQLGRIVKASSNYPSVSAMLQSLKIEKAKDLLRNPYLSIAEVAEQSGFASEYYFIRLFKREIGMPPGRYRKSLTGQ